MITQEKLKSLLDYDPLTGIFKWYGKKSYLKMAGNITLSGYVRLNIKGEKHFAHRLAWLYVYGYFPNNHIIDHIDRNKLNNRINNLRVVSRQCNNRNTGNPKNNTSGVKGVCWDNSKKRWLAEIKISRKKINLGRHKSLSEAVCHRLAAEQSVDWSGCDSSSPAFLYVKNLVHRHADLSGRFNPLHGAN